MSQERKIFVGGISDQLDSDLLQQLVEATGVSVKEVQMPLDRSSGHHRGFAFVYIDEGAPADAVETVVDGLDGSMQAGQPLRVEAYRVQPPPSSRRGAESLLDLDESTLYVGNLPFDIAPEQLLEFFHIFGVKEARRAYLPLDHLERSRGFAFVVVEGKETAKRLVNHMDPISVHGRVLTLSIAKSRTEHRKIDEDGPRSIPPNSVRMASLPPPSSGHRSFKNGVNELSDDCAGKKA